MRNHTTFSVALGTTGEAARGRAARTFDPPCSPENLRRLVREGRLTPAAIVGRGVMLFDLQAVREFDKARRAKRG